MYIKTSRKGNELTVIIAGRIDVFGTLELKPAINDKIDENTNIIFDFKDVEYITASGIKSLLAFKKKVSNGSLKIINATNEIYDIFVTTGFINLVDVSKMESDIFTYYSASIKKILRTKVSCFPNKVFLQNSRESYTWEEIDKCSQIIAYDLSLKGVKKGTHVGIYSTNSINWVLTFFALQKIGAIACLLNNAYNVAELKNISKVGDITFLCYGDGNASKEDSNFLEKIIHVQDSSFIGYYNISDNIGFKSRLNEYGLISGLFGDYVDADDICAMIYTSGSTGTPKGVMLSAFNILNSSLAMGCDIDISENDKLCLILPLFHIFGITAGLFTNFEGNASIYIPDNTKTSTLLKVIEEEKCTLFHSVPTMVLALMNNPEFSEDKIKTLRCSFLAGAPITTAQLEQAAKRFVKNHFVVAYGLTEMAPISITDINDDFNHLSSTVGKPVYSIKVKAQNIQTGVDCKVGEEGEILACGYSATSGYYKADLEKQPIDDDGWIHTGDLGFLDKDGYLHLTGRAKDIIIRGGENITPNEVADEISKHTNVADVKVVGVPDDFFGEIVCACLVLKDETKFDENEMNEFLKDKLAKFKIPAKYVLYEEFPLLGNGKIDMVTLKKSAAQK